MFGLNYVATAIIGLQAINPIAYFVVLGVLALVSLVVVNYVIKPLYISYVEKRAAMKEFSIRQRSMVASKN